MFDKLGRLQNSASGVTLVETLVALGIMTVVMGLMGSSIFNSLSIKKFWLDDVVATREARHAGSWLGGDVMNAEEVCVSEDVEMAPDTDLNSPHASVILVWYDIPSDDTGLLPDVCSLDTSPSYTINTATYEIDENADNHLTRKVAVDGVVQSTQVLSKRVTQVGFLRSVTGDVLTMALSVEADRGTNEDLTLDTFLRRLRI